MQDELRHPTEILEKDIDKFYQEIESLLYTLPIFMVLTDSLKYAKYNKYIEYMEENALGKEIVEDKTSYTIDIEHQARTNKLNQEHENFVNAYKFIPRHYLISMVSHFDSLLCRIIRFIFTVNPEIFNASEKTFSYSDIIQFQNISSVKEYWIEKEIESIIRKSHSDQFEWLKQKLGTPFNKDLECWPVFIELTERRNLFVHTDGKVTSQYLSVCRQHDCVLPLELKVGDQLDVSKDYFEKSFRCICEIGFKLAHVIWRRLCSDQLAKADTHIMVFTVDIINKEMYELAIAILEFFTRKEIKFHNEAARRTMIINKAQAYKWKEDELKCIEILEEEDWTLVDDKFKLAIAALREEYNTCYSIMRRVKNDTEFHKSYFKDWPIFKTLRLKPEFNSEYLECYGEEFAHGQFTDKLEISISSKDSEDTG